jgi:hypothetical protein
MRESRDSVNTRDSVDSHNTDENKPSNGKSITSLQLQLQTPGGDSKHSQQHDSNSQTPGGDSNHSEQHDSNGQIQSPGEGAKLSTKGFVTSRDTIRDSMTVSSVDDFLRGSRTSRDMPEAARDASSHASRSISPVMWNPSRSTGGSTGNNRRGSSDEKARVGENKAGEVHGKLRMQTLVACVDMDPCGDLIMCADSTWHKDVDEVSVGAMSVSASLSVCLSVSARVSVSLFVFVTRRRCDVHGMRILCISLSLSVCLCLSEIYMSNGWERSCISQLQIMYISACILIFEYMHTHNYRYKTNRMDGK